MTEAQPLRHRARWLLLIVPALLFVAFLVTLGIPAGDASLMAGILIGALVVGVILQTLQMTLPRPLRFLLIGGAVLLFQQCSDRWIYGSPQPAPTRAELQQMVDDYPDAGIWAELDRGGDSYDYDKWTPFLQLILGIDTVIDRQDGDTRFSINGDVLWEHKMRMPLGERLEETARNHTEYLDREHPIPNGATIPLGGYLDMENVLGTMDSWEVTEDQRDAFAAVLLDLIDTRLRYPLWPGFRQNLGDLALACAYLEEIERPMEDLAHVDAIQLLLLDCYKSSSRGGWGFASPDSRWVNAEATLWAIELMHRFGVPEGVDLEEMRTHLERGWPGWEDFEFFEFDEGLALLRLGELEAKQLPAE